MKNNISRDKILPVSDTAIKTTLSEEFGASDQKISLGDGRKNVWRYVGFKATVQPVQPVKAFSTNNIHQIWDIRVKPLDTLDTKPLTIYENNLEEVSN